MPLDAALDHREGALAKLLLELVVVSELGAGLLGHLDHVSQGRHLKLKSFNTNFVTSFMSNNVKLRLDEIHLTT